jgi:phosphoglycolate phosphatase-like HAD superfamily hydrolase
MLAAALLDVDGTLVDTNYQHALAWFRALRMYDLTVPLWRIHRHIGMGGDKLVAAVTDEQTDERIGDDVRAAEGDLYRELIGEVTPLPEARELVLDLKERGHEVVLSSSAKEDEVGHYLDLLDLRDVVDGWTTSADVEATKPAPDLVAAARSKARAERAVMLGDTTWDCEAAARAGVPAIALLTGGFGAAELREAGAVAIYEQIADLRADLAQSAFSTAG